MKTRYLQISVLRAGSASEGEAEAGNNRAVVCPGCSGSSYTPPPLPHSRSSAARGRRSPAAPGDRVPVFTSAPDKQRSQDGDGTLTSTSTLLGSCAATGEQEDEEEEEEGREEEEV